jgi:hypothetical protein
LIKF